METKKIKIREKYRLLFVNDISMKKDILKIFHRNYIIVSRIMNWPPNLCIVWILFRNLSISP